MKNLLRLEELAILVLAIFLFRSLDYAWWWYLVLFLAPDLGMVGYLAGARVGALAYNTTHHRAIAVGAYVAGTLAGAQPLQLAGVIVLGHAAFDRILGFGLKYPDSFQHTHLGMLGGRSQA